MTTIQLVAAHAPDSDTQARTISGLVLPYGRPGYTNAGAVTVNAGAVTLPEDITRVKLLRDHSTEQGFTPVGYATAVEDTPEGLRMSFKIGKTADGDVALADVTEKVRDALSVELIQTAIDGDTLTAGTVTAVALVPIPAFADARVDLITASLAHEDEQEEQDDNQDDAEGQETSGDDDNVNTNTDPEPKEPEMPPTPKPAKAPDGLHAANKQEPLTFSRAVDTMAAMGRGQRPELTAALDDVTYAANPATRAPEWLGELWSGLQYQRKIVNTMTHGTLTKMKAVGWRWVNRPEVDDYTGNKTAIPTNTPSTEAVEQEAKRLAAGWDFDRAYIDFNETEFLSSFFEAVREDYARKTDMKAAAALVGWAATDSAHTVESQPDLLRAAAMANVVFDDAINVKPTTYLVNSMDLFELLDFTKLDIPEYLALLGVDPASFTTSPLAPRGQMTAYHKQAVKFSELAGSPIRVSAQHIALGGVDEAVFGYWDAMLQDARGIATIPFGTSTEG